MTSASSRSQALAPAGALTTEPKFEVYVTSRTSRSGDRMRSTQPCGTRSARRVDGDDDLAFGVPFTEIPQRLRHLI